MSSLCNIESVLPIGILVLDADMNIVRWNPWLEDHTGINSAAAEGHNLKELYPDLNKPRFEDAVSQVIKFGAPQLLSHALNRYVIPISIAGRRSVDSPDMMQQQVHVARIFDHESRPLALVSIEDISDSIVRMNTLADIAGKLDFVGSHDPLTKAYNRHFMTKWLTAESKLARRHRFPIACVLFDIDHFKLINDSFGHERGDVVLQEVAQLAQSCLREADILVRFGGEEFLALLSQCDEENAAIIAERIRHFIQASEIADLSPGQVTCSAGLSAYSPNDDPDTPLDPKQLFRVADKYLYQAKKAGRNMVVWKNSVIQPRS